MAQHVVPGVAVAVTVDGQAFFHNHGAASYETKKPVSETTIFELGCVSKTFTATLALSPQALGKLSLADHPGRYMRPLLGAPIDQATPLQLGTCSADGLPLQFPADVVDDAQMLRCCQTWPPANRPGTRRRHTNPSIGLLGRMAGLALERGFADAVEAELLPPLGLTPTSVRVPPSATDDCAWGHDKANRPVRVTPGVFDAEADGVKSTAADMVRFVQLQLDPSGWAKRLRHAKDATHQGHLAVGEMVQGLGWEQYTAPTLLATLRRGHSHTVVFEPHGATPVIQPLAAPRLINKMGSTGGFGAYDAFVTERRNGVVRLAHCSIPIPDRVRAAFTILEGLAASTT